MKNCELIDADEGKHNGCSSLGEQANADKDIHIGCTSLGEQVAGISEVTDQTAPLPTNTINRIDKIETEIKNFESKFMDKILTAVNDMNILKNYCLNNGLECVNGLRQENIKLKEENNALKDSLRITKYALSDLNYKVKDLENQKDSFTTALKILYQDSHQHHEYCSKQKDSNVDAYKNCLNKTKSVMTQIDSDITHSQSRLSDEPIIVLDHEGAGLKKVTKSCKTKTNIDKRPQTPTHTSKQNSSGGNPLFNNEVTTVAAHSTIKNFHNTKGGNQANDPVPLILNTEAKKVDIEVNDVNDLNSTNVSVSEISSQNNPNLTTRFNKPSYSNTQTPKHLVPCPFLRRKRHCVKGSTCDFSHSVNSHRPLQVSPSGSTSSFRVPSPYPGDFSRYINSQQPLQSDPRGFPSLFREPSPYPGPLFPPAIFHPFMNHLYALPFTYRPCNP